MYSILNWKTAHTISIGMFWSGLGGVKERNNGKDFTTRFTVTFISS